MKFRSPPLSPANVIDVTVEGVAALALIDTGAAVSVLNERLRHSLRKVTTPLSDLTLRTGSAQEIKPLAMCTARVIIQDVTYVIEFIVLHHVPTT